MGSERRYEPVFKAHILTSEIHPAVQSASRRRLSSWGGNPLTLPSLLPETSFPLYQTEPQSCSVLSSSPKDQLKSEYLPSAVETVHVLKSFPNNKEKPESKKLQNPNETKMVKFPKHYFVTLELLYPRETSSELSSSCGLTPTFTCVIKLSVEQLCLC